MPYFVSGCINFPFSSSPDLIVLKLKLRDQNLSSLIKTLSELRLET